MFTYCEFASNWNTTQDLVNLQYSQYIARADRVDDMLRIAINDALPPDPAHFQNNDQGRWSWMALTGGEVTGWDTNREAFLGPYRSYDRPLVVEQGKCTG